MADGDGAVEVGLPVAASPLIGRGGELAGARVVLGAARLVTLVGTGGAGKTRLALEVAHQLSGEYRDGGVFVDLAPLREPGQVLPAVARAVGLFDAGAQPLTVTVYRQLRDRQVLLVLDNFEHLLGAAEGIVELLAQCAGVRVLVTSRAPLQAPGEHLLVVDPLPVPDPRELPAPAALGATASVALFVDRVRAACPDFALDQGNARTVAEICISLDGLPLALELAAAQVRPYGLVEVLARTRNRFDLLRMPRRAVTERHRSLAAAVAWSVELLDAPTQRMFGRLSVFLGGWTAQAAERVCGEPGQDVLPVLATLVEHSLVVSSVTAGGVRYRMLETLREYAAGLVTAAGDQDRLQHRLLGWCRELTPRGKQTIDAQETIWIDRAETELHNIRAALDGCAPQDTAAALRVAALLYRFWDGRGYLGEGRRHLERLLARPPAVESPRERAQALDTLGLLVLWQDEHPAARAALAESAAVSEQLGDLERVAWSTSSIVMSRFMTGDSEGVDPMGERAVALARAVGAPGTLSRATCALGLLRWAQGRRADALVLLRESLALGEQMGYVWGRGKLSYFLGWCAFLDGDLAEAARLQRVSAQAYLQVGDRRSLPDTLDVLGCLAAKAGQHAAAVRLFAATARLRATAGSRRHQYLRPQCEAAEHEARCALGAAAVARVVGHIDTLPLDRVARAALAPDDPATTAGGVTPRELEVAGMVADGLTNRQIGRALGISERTAERHVENLRGKLNVHTRAQIAAWVTTQPTPRI